MRDFASGQRVLLIGGSLNQTTMMHAIGRHLSGHRCAYSAYYADGVVDWAARRGYLDWTVLGGPMRRQTLRYLANQGLHVDHGGRERPYDLAVTGSDLLVQRNIRRLPVVLVQEGMTDPENWLFHLVRHVGVPRWMASTSATGLSRAYRKFCVASEGFRDLFIARGVPAERIVVTGIPNFDDCASYCHNDFPYRGYTLVATSDTRETLKHDSRATFYRRVREIAGQRPIIVKLHPNENVRRSTAEIDAALPGALVLSDGNAHHMVANCEALITQYSTLVFVGIALGKECHSNFDMSELERLAPLQNGGTSAARIARVCELAMAEEARSRSRAIRGAHVVQEAS